MLCIEVIRDDDLAKARPGAGDDAGAGTDGFPGFRRSVLLFRQGGGLRDGHQQQCEAAQECHRELRFLVCVARRMGLHDS